MSRITVYDKAGILIAEIDALVKRSWLTNAFGTATFAISVFDQKCRKEIVEFGNNILIQHDKLPDWGGIIMTPRIWGRGVVQITAYSAMWKYKRIRGDNATGWFTSPVDLITKLTDRINAYSDSRIRINQMDGTSGGYQMILSHTVQVYDNLKTMLDTFPNSYLEFIPAFDDSRRIIFNANWRKFTSILSKTMLDEGNNIEDVGNILTEQGDIVNYLRNISKGWWPADQAEINILDQASWDYYGCGSKTETLTTNSYYGGSGTPAEETLNRLNFLKQPRKYYNFRVLDIGDSWKDMRIGALLQLKLNNAGFFGSSFGTIGNTRISGMSFDDNGALEIVCEESI